jgi:hypothetical protein
MVHQMPPDLIAGIGQPVRQRAGGRHEQQLGRFDRMRRNDYDLGSQGLVGLVGTAVVDGCDRAVLVRVQLVDDRAVANLGTGLGGEIEVHHGVVLGADGAHRDAEGIAAALRATVESCFRAHASGGGGKHLETQRFCSVRELRVGPGERNRRHRIVAAARCAVELLRVPRHTHGLFGGLVPRLQIVV